MRLVMLTLLGACQGTQNGQGEVQASAEGPVTASDTLRIVYTNNLDGEIEPCG